MSISTMTLTGLYNYDPTIFDNLQIPANLSRETLVDNILLECSELEIIYTDPTFLRFAIGAWSEVKRDIWASELATLSIEYSPLENYDRREEYTDAETGDSRGKNNSDTTSTGAQTAFDTDTFKDASRSIGTETGSAENDYRRKVTHTSRIHGNIGVTTSQQMLMAQLDVDKINIYDIIVTDFKRRFCLLVY